MKKTIALLLAVIMCFSLFACSGNDEENRNNDPQNNHGENVENNEKSEYKREITDEGYVVISTAEFASYITKIELTIENWQEYLEIVELTEQERNGFGEIINSYTSTEFTAKNAIGCYFDDVAINFADIQTGAKIYCEGQFHRIIIPDNYSYSWEGYTVNDFVLTTGICEDILNEVDIEKLIEGKLDEQTLGFEILKIVKKSFNKFSPFLQDVFDGLTDDEYRSTSIKEVANVIINIVKYTISELYSVGNNSKN